MNAEDMVIKLLELSVLIRENSDDSWIKSQQRRSEVQVHAGLSTVPTIEPGLRRNIKSTGREFRRDWRDQSFAFEQPASGGGEEGGQFRSRGGIRAFGRNGLHSRVLLRFLWEPQELTEIREVRKCVFL